MPNGNVAAQTPIAWSKITLSLALTTVLGVSGWTLVKVVNAQSDIAAIKSSRFTAEDGLNVWKEIASIRTEIASMPKEVPPAWFISRVDRIETKLDMIDHRITTLHATKDQSP